MSFAVVKLKPASRKARSDDWDYAILAWPAHGLGDPRRFEVISLHETRADAAEALLGASGRSAVERIEARDP